jgi:hypothetical protein
METAARGFVLAFSVPVYGWRKRMGVKPGVVMSAW